MNEWPTFYDILYKSYQTTKFVSEWPTFYDILYKSYQAVLSLRVSDSLYIDKIYIPVKFLVY